MFRKTFCSALMILLSSAALAEARPPVLPGPRTPVVVAPGPKFPCPPPFTTTKPVLRAPDRPLPHEPAPRPGLVVPWFPFRPVANDK
jgi:hypothetical protein